MQPLKKNSPRLRYWNSRDNKWALIIASSYYFNLFQLYVPSSTVEDWMIYFEYLNVLIQVT